MLPHATNLTVLCTVYMPSEANYAQAVKHSERFAPHYTSIGHLHSGQSRITVWEQKDETVPEKLRIVQSKDPSYPVWILETEQRQFLGRFSTAEEAESWCRRNEYRYETIP